MIYLYIVLFNLFILIPIFKVTNILPLDKFAEEPISIHIAMAILWPAPLFAIIFYLLGQCIKYIFKLIIWIILKIEKSLNEIIK
jgi:hypothetical protein